MKERGSNGSGEWLSEEIQGKPTSPVASNVLLQVDAKLYRVPNVEGRRRRLFICEAGAPSEGKPADQLNLARGAGGGQDLALVIGEITRRILEDGIPVTSKGKRTLGITRNAKIRMVEQVISFHSNRNLPFLSDRKLFVQRQRQIARTPAPAGYFVRHCQTDRQAEPQKHLD